MRSPEEWPSRPGSPGRTEFGLQVRLPQTFLFNDLPHSKFDCDAGVTHSDRSAVKIKMMIFRHPVSARKTAIRQTLGFAQGRGRTRSGRLPRSRPDNTRLDLILLIELAFICRGVAEGAVVLDSQQRAFAPLSLGHLHSSEQRLISWILP